MKSFTVRLCTWAACLASLLPAVCLAEKPTDVYLLIGQSNMAGRGKLTPSNRVDTTRVVKWNGWQQKPDGDAWVDAVEPLTCDRTYSGAGPGASFGRAMADANANAIIGLIPTAQGGSSLESWMPGQGLYNRALRWTRAALASGGSLKGILWHQGCSDSYEIDTATNYATRLSIMVSALRRDLNAPNVPFVAGELGGYLDSYRSKDDKTGEIKQALPYWREINRQLEMAVRMIPSMRLVKATGLKHMGDHLHFDTASARELGQRYAEAMNPSSVATEWIYSTQTTK